MSSACSSFFLVPYLLKSPEDENDFADYLVLHGAVLREETCCKWLKDCIRLCKKGV